jgi:ribosomal protein S12 methylthiotransferase accessory factor
MTLRRCLVLHADVRRVRDVLPTVRETMSIEPLESPDVGLWLSDPAHLVRLSRDRVQLAHWDPAKRGTCPGCLERRCRESEQGRLESWTPLSDESLSPTTGFAAAVLELILESHLETHEGVDLDLKVLRWKRFWLEPYPGCPRCADRSQKASPVEAPPIELRYRPKRASNVYRLHDADELPLMPQRYVNETCGFLGRSHSRNIVQPFAARVHGAFFHGNHRVSWGANASSYRTSLAVGLCEAFERYAALTYRGNGKIVTGRLVDLRERALNPHDCGLHDAEFYSANPALQPFSENTEIRWVEGYSLTQQRTVLVPTQLVYHGGPADREPRFVFSNSNGCATGTCLEEAILFGILEVIERDALMLHWLAMLSPTRISLDAVGSPHLQVLLARLRVAGYEVTVLDARVDMPIPTTIAVVRRRDAGYGAFSIGASCHFDPERAVLSSISDAAARHVGFAERTCRAAATLRAMLADFRLVRAIPDHGALYGLPDAARHASFLTEGREIPYEAVFKQWNNEVPQSVDLREDVDYLLRILARAGLPKVIVVDQTSTEGLRAGLHTVKILIPGAIPVDFGYGKCRAAGLPRLAMVAASAGRRLTPIRDRIPHPFA